MIRRALFLCMVATCLVLGHAAVTTDCTVLGASLDQVWTCESVSGCPNDDAAQFLLDIGFITTIDEPYECSTPEDPAVLTNACCNRTAPATGSGCVQGWGFWRQESRRTDCFSVGLCNIDDTTLLQASPKGGNRWLVNAHLFLGAHYSRTCGCAQTNATDNQFLDANGVLLIEQCDEDGVIPFVGPSDTSGVGDQLLANSFELKAYLNGSRSVDVCTCDADDEFALIASRHDVEVQYEQSMLDAMQESGSYTPGYTDIAYKKDPITGLPTGDVDVGIVAVICVAAAACIGLVVVGVATAGVIIRRRNKESAENNEFGPLGGSDDVFEDLGTSEDAVSAYGASTTSLEMTDV